VLIHILRIELFWQLAVSKFKLIDLKRQRSKSFIYSIFSHNAGELPVILLPMSVGDICEQKAFTSAVRNNSCHQGHREDLRGTGKFFLWGLYDVIFVKEYNYKIELF